MNSGVALSRSRSFILRLVLVTAILLPAVCGAKEPGVAIQFDPNTPNAGIWLGYLISRTAYRLKHKLPLPESGIIVPGFDEEVDARTGTARMYQALKEKDKRLHDPYWETLSRIRAKGFMNAYVWTYLRRPNWPKSQQPRNLADFQNWSRSHLQSHQAVTYGALSVERK